MADLDEFVNILGVGLSAITYKQFFEKIDFWLKNKATRSHHIACLNAYCVTLATKDEALKDIYCAADIAGADGMPFVYWARWFKRKEIDRLDGPEMVLRLADRAKETGYTFYLYGGGEKECKQMNDFLLEKFPHLIIVGYHSPPFRELTRAEDDAIVAEINALKPDVICVGLGTPKQDYWIDNHLHKIPGSVMIGCGAAFDFFGGRIKMAPRFVRVSGFEWLYRLLGRDFKRLFMRYTYMNFVFLGKFLLQTTRLRSYPLRRISRL